MRPPVARPTVSTPSLLNPAPRPDSPPTPTTKDPGPARVRPLTKDRLETLSRTLGPDDRAVIDFLARVRLATGFQLARRFWAATSPSDPQARSARRVLGRLESSQVIERLDRRVGGVRGGSTSIVYGLGLAGQRLLEIRGTGRKLGTPGARYVHHSLAITELGVRLHEATLAGDAELLGTEYEPDCWRRYLSTQGAVATLKPDLFIRLAAGRAEDRWFIEVDLATEAGPTIRRKAQRYLDYLTDGTEQRTTGAFPRVLWTVPDAHRRDRLAEVMRKLPEPANRLFSVWLFDEAVARLAAEARA